LGVRWVALKPRRKDPKADSLSISASAGKWKDFSQDDNGYAGADVNEQGYSIR
jgi:hypothetical protein